MFDSQNAIKVQQYSTVYCGAFNRNQQNKDINNEAVSEILLKQLFPKQRISRGWGGHRGFRTEDSIAYMMVGRDLDKDHVAAVSIKNPVELLMP